MKPLILTLAVTLSLLSLPRPIMAQVTSGQVATVQPSPMPAERAKATLDDERVKTFMSVLEKDFDGKCSVPDYTQMNARLKQVGSGDFTSSFYEVSIPCTGKNGLAGIQITVEFSPPLGTPLNLLLSLQFKR